MLFFLGRQPHLPPSALDLLVPGHERRVVGCGCIKQVPEVGQHLPRLLKFGVPLLHDLFQGDFLVLDHALFASSLVQVQRLALLKFFHLVFLCALLDSLGDVLGGIVVVLLEVVQADDDIPGIGGRAELASELALLLPLALAHAAVLASRKRQLLGVVA